MSDTEGSQAKVRNVLFILLSYLSCNTSVLIVFLVSVSVLWISLESYLSLLSRLVLYCVNFMVPTGRTDFRYCLSSLYIVLFWSISA